MRTDHDSQLLKGVLSLLLLKLIAERESYGYELVTRLHDLGLADVPDGSVYPALGRLEREGHVRSRLVPSSAGPARKYYRLSARGRAALEAREAAWRRLAGVVEALLAAPIPTLIREVRR